MNDDQGQDATLDFYSALSDPSRWIIKKGVPVFKAHERTDPNTGKLIKVDVPKLYRIAANMQKLERQHGVPIRMTLGHTEPGKPEILQPPVGGYYRNPRVASFGPKGEPAVVVDEWLDPQYGAHRKNYPYRSAEYYDDTEQITGVALLTRDPFLDLGVVAYQRFQLPVPYRYVMADDPHGEYVVWPNIPQPTPYGTPGVPLVNPYQAQTPPQVMGPVPQPQQPVPVVYQQAQAAGYAQAQTPPQDFAQYFDAAGQPVQVPQQTYTSPTQPTAYTGTWPGPAHQRANIGHSHPSGGAVYGQQQTPTGYSPMSPRGGMGGRPMPSRPRPMGGGMGRPGMGRPMMSSGYSNQQPGRYATDPPEDDGPPMPGGGGGGDLMGELYSCLSQALQIIGQMGGGDAGPPGAPTGGAADGPPQSPFPEQMSRQRGGRPAQNSRHQQYYQRQQAPQQPQQPVQRTISGLPVGYQMRLDQQQYQINEQNRAIQVLLYERDQADTAACVAEIQKFAALGYQVGEYEVNELKNKKTPEERGAYLQHIAAKYQKVPTDMPPALHGDPTPVTEQDITGRPLSEQEMGEALRLSQGHPDPAAFSKAVNYVKGQRVNRGPAVGQQQFQANPYQPSANGVGAY